MRAIRTVFAATAGLLLLFQGGCGVDADANRGYRLFVETITANGIDEETETFSPIGGAQLDIFDCTELEAPSGTTTQNTFVDRTASFNLVVDVSNGFNFSAGAGLDVQLVTVIRSYSVIDGVNVQLQDRRIDFGTQGPVIDVDDSDRVEQAVVLPFFSIDQAQEYVDQVLGINGGTDYTSEILFTYQFYAQDNFGETVSTTVAFPVSVGSFADACN